jgi:hypothetical protein
VENRNAPTIAEIEFGTDLGGGELSPLHQICPKKEGETLRIALLTQFCKPKATYYHWHRNRFYRCNTEKDGPIAPCCEIRRGWTCVCLAVAYLGTDPDGKLRKGPDIRYRVGYVSLSENAFRQVKVCVRKARGCDLYYSMTEGYYSFSRARRAPAWKLSPQAAKVEAEAVRWADGEKLREKLGRVLTNPEWVRLLKTGSIYEIEELD